MVILFIVYTYCLGYYGDIVYCLLFLISAVYLDSAGAFMVMHQLMYMYM